MKILAIDTSSIVATVALMEGDKLMAEYILNNKKNHSEHLMPIIEEVMKSCELSPKDIDVYAVALGPGSFTGLRIGIATIKSMAQALDKPIIGISSLEALAYNLIYSKDIICPIIDAQRDMVYTGLFKWDGLEFIRLKEDRVIPIEELIQELKLECENIVFLGDAVDKFKSFILENLDERAIFAPGIVKLPRASSIGELARQRAEKGEFQDFKDILPIYMRKSQAERQWEERRKKQE